MGVKHCIVLQGLIIMKYFLAWIVPKHAMTCFLYVAVPVGYIKVSLGGSREWLLSLKPHTH